jgi:predicted 2-oxoglutarate/Fe(II)-dependent dioxygenase YbiX/peroxiredoxin
MAVRFIEMRPGEPAPHFRQRSCSNPRFTFDSAAGRYLVLCFFGTARDAHSQAALRAALSARKLFNDVHASFFGVTSDPADEPNLREVYPGYRYFLDFDLAVSRLYGSAPTEAQPGETSAPLRRFWLVIDPMLRIIRRIMFRPDQSDIAEALALLEALPPPAHHAGQEMQAPILLLPNVFEPEFCERLMRLYETAGNEESGFMREIDGKTVYVQDHGHKRRRDHNITDQEIVREARTAFARRVAPQIQKFHQFTPTHMERYLVACYDADDNAHFRPHRDNTTGGTAHRRFAASVNLNADFDGGEVWFPEFGLRSYKPPPGSAVVFSCSMLHAVTPVTRGRRYAFLPFLYDGAAAKIREANLGKVEQQTPK